MATGDFEDAAETILGKNKVVQGLAQVIEKIGFGSHNLAWDFLTDSVEFHDGFARPLDLLLSGRVTKCSTRSVDGVRWVARQVPDFKTCARIGPWSITPNRAYLWGTPYARGLAFR